MLSLRGMEKRRGRPTKDDPGVLVPLKIPTKLNAYLEELVKIQGFGESKQDVIKQFVWTAVNDLIGKRLKPR